MYPFAYLFVCHLCTAFNDANSNPNLLNRNREFFVDKDDVFLYIQNYGTESTNKPASPIGRRRAQALHRSRIESSYNKSNTNRNNYQETLVPVMTKSGDGRSQQPVIAGRSLQRMNSVEKSSSTDQASAHLLNTSPLSDNTSDSPFRVAGRLPHSPLRRAYDPEHNFERLIAASGGANLDPICYDVSSRDSDSNSTPSRSSSRSQEIDIDGMIYSMLLETTVRFGNIMTALRKKGWTYKYAPRKAWEGFDALPPGRLPFKFNLTSISYPRHTIIIFNPIDIIIIVVVVVAFSL